MMDMKWISLGMKLFPLIQAAVQSVEKLTGILKSSAKGKEKQDAAVETVGTLLDAFQIGIDKKIIETPSVQQAMRSAIDAYVAFQNAIAHADEPAQ